MICFQITSYPCTTLRGRHNTWRYRMTFSVAGKMFLELGWLWWRALWTPLLFASRTWHLAMLTIILCGRRGNWQHPCVFCVTGVTGVTLTALGWLWWRAWFPVVDAGPVFMQGYFLNIEPYFPRQALRIVMSSFFGWQAWHLATSTFPIPLWYATPEPTLPRHTTSFTHHFVIPSSFKHCLWHTIFHTQLCHRHLLTHHCVTHCLSHIIFYHNFFHTQRCHALSF